MKIISILGLIVAFTPFLGIPTSWKTSIFFVLGLAIFMKSFLIYRKEKNLFDEEATGRSSFKQNDNPILLPTEFVNEDVSNVKEIDSETEEIKIK